LNADKAIEGFDNEGCLSTCASRQSKCVGGFSGPSGLTLNPKKGQSGVAKPGAGSAATQH